MHPAAHLRLQYATASSCDLLLPPCVSTTSCLYLSLETKFLDVSHFHCTAGKLQGLVPAAHLPLLSFRAQLPPDFTHGLLGVQSFHLEQSTVPGDGGGGGGGGGDEDDSFCVVAQRQSPPPATF